MNALIPVSPQFHFKHQHTALSWQPEAPPQNSVMEYTSRFSPSRGQRVRSSGKNNLMVTTHQKTYNDGVHIPAKKKDDKTESHSKR